MRWFISLHWEVTLILHEWSNQVVNQGDIQAVGRPRKLVWAPKLWHPKNTFQVLLFQLYFNKKYVEVPITHFTMHLIISKWLRRKKCQSKRRTCLWKCFHLFKYTKDYKNVCFFFLVSLQTFSKSLNDVNSLH